MTGRGGFSILFVWLFLCVPVFSLTWDVSIHGVVVDDLNKPLPRCLVVLKGVGVSTYTDEKGAFAIERLTTSLSNVPQNEIRGESTATYDLLGRSVGNAGRQPGLTDPKALRKPIMVSVALANSDTLVFQLATYQEKKLAIPSYTETLDTVVMYKVYPRLSYLKANGNVIQNTNKDVVDLRGVNLGGWLVTENWMNGFSDETDLFTNRFSLETLEERFGEDSASTLIEIWRKNFLTEADLDSLDSLGINLVRVPFGYRNLQNKDGSWKTLPNGSIDFSWMDWIVDQAEERGIYVIFDYHIWKGQEEGRLSNPADGAKNVAAYRYITDGPDDDKRKSQRAHAIEVWKQVMNHYRGRGAVAAFDLINEANGGTWASVFLYEALREYDKDRLLMIEGDPKNATANWYNIMYGGHFYSCQSSDFAVNKSVIDTHIENMRTIQTNYKVPIYMGEYHIDNEESHRYLLQQYANNHISWSKWTYKGVNIGNWALQLYSKPLVGVDIAHDSYATIKSKWEQLSTISVSPNGLVEKIISDSTY